tara:strand:+ start:621 stop:797 length:177 start_codon:yes stop_codon:yes gene_type:complete
MDFQTVGGPKISLEMETVEAYRKKAAGYRCSAQYTKMVGLYPVLGDSIKGCQDEKLIN